MQVVMPSSTFSDNHFWRVEPPHDILTDSVVAQQMLREVMELYDHKNLDALPEFVRADGARSEDGVASGDRSREDERSVPPLPRLRDHRKRARLPGGAAVRVISLRRPATA